jgi:glycosyltransferase involved in cell wall biosynthesis
MYLTTLPFYRQFCMEELSARIGKDLTVFSGPSQIGGSVRTGINRELYNPLKVWFLGNAAMVHFGGWRKAVSAESLVVDLNPRCVTAWMLLALRALLRRRTLVWGHLHPRSGPSSRTAVIRRAMRRLADGTVLYGYDSVLPAKHELPNQDVWVAPNSLYPARDLGRDPENAVRDTVVYVGRLVEDKKVDLLIRAFSMVDADNLRLVIAGAGEQREELERLTAELGYKGRVTFLGTVTGKSDLKELYSRALCAVSPGYAGLSLTQSLGFGVPILVADDEPHAPEIELERFGAVIRFAENSVQALAGAIRTMERNPFEPAMGTALADDVSRYYSAETMAAGLFDALHNNPVELDEQGWPERVQRQ